MKVDDYVWFVRTEDDEVACNFGHPHRVKKVVDIVLTRVVEIRDVYGSWTGNLYKNGGAKCVTPNNEMEFFSNWVTYDDASMGTSWYGPEGHWEPVSKYTTYYDPHNYLVLLDVKRIT